MIVDVVLSSDFYLYFIKYLGKFMDDWLGVVGLSEKKICELIIKNTKDAIIYLEPILNSDGHPVDFTFLFVNDVVFKTLQGSRDDLLGKSFSSVFTNSTGVKFLNYMIEVIETKKPIQVDFLFNNEKFSGWLSNYITPAGDGILCFYSDITNQKIIEEQKELTERNLEESYTLINEILESIQDPFLVLDKELRIVYMNKESVNALGGSGEYPKGAKLWDAFPSVRNIRSFERYAQLVKEKKTVTFETKSDAEYYLVSAFPFAGGVSVYTKNITERILLERKLRSTVKEKELLIKEIHHRVKNNLQIVASILNLQCSYIADPADIALFQDTQTRVKAMALIHKKLYENDSINTIELGSYINDITATIFNAYNVSTNKIKLLIKAEELEIETNNAVSLGLILNELITNAIKYAYPGERTGVITINEEIKKDQVNIVIHDDGVGFPKDVDFRKLQSLGMQLVLSLIQQLDGSIDLDNTSGTNFILTFEIKKLQHK